jgi:amidohydrolase
MKEILEGVTEKNGGGFDFEFNEGYPAVINDEKLTKQLSDAARKVLGDDGVIELKKPIMAGEDFAFYQQEFPGAFFFLGSGSDEADSRWSWHHPRYNVDERCMLTGSALMAGLVLRTGT